MAILARMKCNIYFCISLYASFFYKEKKQNCIFIFNRNDEKLFFIPDIHTGTALMQGPALARKTTTRRNQIRTRYFLVGAGKDNNNSQAYKSKQRENRSLAEKQTLESGRNLLCISWRYLRHRTTERSSWPCSYNLPVSKRYII